jgi:hypothetical protein
VNGWIKLHRKLLKNPIFYKPELLQLFIYCLLTAGHEEQKILFNGKEEVVPIGSFITGRKALSAMLKQSENKIRQNLKILENCSIIERKVTNKFTLIKIVNYYSYQTSDNENHQQITNKSPTNHQQITTNKNIRTKELKNKELKHISDSPPLFSPDFERFWQSYPNFNRNKKGAYKNYQACLKGESRLNKATPEHLLRSAKRYADEVKGKDKQFVLHASTFLGPAERWVEYDKPLTCMSGEIRDDVDINDFRIEGGPTIDIKAYERARRGLDPYTPKPD